jgi:hypothetical protein
VSYPSGHGIIPKYVRFQLQLSEPVLENIADADDPHELIAVLDRHMANVSRPQLGASMML